MSVAETMHKKLTAALNPRELVILDESARHAGHAGARPGGESHFSVRIISDSFKGLSRIDRQRRVHAALAEELKFQIHALSLTTLTPDEAVK